MRWKGAISLSFVVCVLLLGLNDVVAEPMPVRFREGVAHGFLVLRDTTGKPLADGELTQKAEGDRVTSHLIFRFKDGSIYDETTVYLQRDIFRILSDHLIE